MTKMLLGMANNVTITKPMFDALLTTLEQLDCTFLVTDYLEDTMGMFETKHSLHLDVNDDMVFSYNTGCYADVKDFSPAFIESIARLNRYDDELYRYILSKLPIEQHRRQRPKHVNYISPQDIPDTIDTSGIQVYQQDQSGGNFKINEAVAKLTDIVVDASTDAPMTAEREQLAQEYTELERQTRHTYMTEINTNSDHLLSRSISLLLPLRHYAFPLCIYCPVVEFYTTYKPMLQTINKQIHQLGHTAYKQQAIVAWLHEFALAIKGSEDVLLMRLHELAQSDQYAPQSACNQGECDSGVNSLQHIANIINRFYGYTEALHRQPSLILQNVPKITNEIEFQEVLEQAL